MKLYNGIVYFQLNYELPNCKVGSIVNIIHADGRECLTVNGITLPYDAAITDEKWFNPVSEKEHQKMCYDNTISYIMETFNLNREDAIEKEKKISQTNVS